MNTATSRTNEVFIQLGFIVSQCSGKIHKNLKRNYTDGIILKLNKVNFDYYPINL
jgi:hypothetical protein